MRISFVIPAYNEERLLPICLDAIKRELSHTQCDAEVIVVNNASTDSTREVALRYEWLQVIDEPNKGLVRARHAGYKVSTGDIIANVDSDTILPNGWIEKVLKEFTNNKHLAALSGPFIYYDLSTFRRLLIHIFYFGGYLIHLFNQYIFHSGAMLQGGNFIVRRTHFEQIGGFNTSIDFYGEDTDIARRISKVGKVKWTFRLPMYTSGRRLVIEGIIVMGLRYSINYIHTLIFRKPFTKTYIDIRNDTQ